MIYIERQFSPDKLHAILNDPSVRSDIAEAPAGYIDVSAGVANTDNVLLMGEFGGCFFIKLMAGIYEVHTQALPEGRGRWIAEFVLAAGDWMFTRTDAFEIVTRIPAAHAGARLLAKHAGMRQEFVRPKECAWRGELQSADIYSYRIQDWAQSAESFDEAGRQFHDFLHSEAERLGIEDEPHDDDPNHNRYVGICLAMVKAGQVRKAVSFYNRWSLISRHRTISLLSESPVTVRFDIGNLIFEPDGSIMHVERVDIAA